MDLRELSDTAIPTDISSPQAKLVYLAILRTESSTVDELQRALAVRKITLFAVLETLVERGLMERQGDRWVTV
ncbi:MAG: helix-turn-helix domain-containing protein [Natrialbaceae archaeon]|nr:helix-turn-helix domain-containing protein [Natrialbaceae archaeon]